MTTFKTIVLDLLQQGHLAEAAIVQALDETERTAIGKQKFWSAKDHLAHMTFCLHQNLILKVTAILQQQEVPPRPGRVATVSNVAVVRHTCAAFPERFRRTQQAVDRSDLLGGRGAMRAVLL